MFINIFDKKNIIYLMVGEAGVSLMHYKGRKMIQRLFLRLPTSDYLIKLDRIMAENPDADLIVLFDNQTQEYTQNLLPSVSSVSASQIAQKAIDTSFQHNNRKSYFRTYIKAYNAQKTQRGLMFTYVEIKLNKLAMEWLDIIHGYPNYVKAKLLLPSESYAIISLHSQALDQTPILFQKIKSIFHPATSHKWEVIVTNNKCSGARFSVFFNSKLIFSRSNPNLISPDPKVSAGGLEQTIAEIKDIIDDHNTEMIEDIDVYIIMPTEILRRIRSDKLKFCTLYKFTPHELYETLDIEDESTNTKDRFSDPIILSSVHNTKNFSSNLQSPIPDNDKVFYILINIVADLIKLSVPVIGILIVILTSYFFFNTSENKRLESEIVELQKTYELKQALTVEQAKAFDYGNDNPMTLEHINEIIDLYEYLEMHSVNPLKVIYDLVKIDREIITFNKILWNYQSSRLNYNEFITLSGAARSNPVDFYRYQFEADAIFNHDLRYYEDFKSRFQTYTEKVQRVFSCCYVAVTQADDNFNLDQFSGTIPIKIIIENGIKQGRK